MNDFDINNLTDEQKDWCSECTSFFAKFCDLYEKEKVGLNVLLATCCKMIAMIAAAHDMPEDMLKEMFRKTKQIMKFIKMEENENGC